MKLYRIVSALAAGMLCLSLAACGSDKPAQVDSVPEPQEDQAPVSESMAVLFAREDAAAELALAGIRAAAQEAGSTLEIVPQYAQGSKNTERELLEGLNPASTAGLVALPVSGDESIAALSRVSERGIPISILGVPSEKAAFAQSNPSCDFYALGSALGRQAKAHIESAFTGKANLAVIQHNTKDSTGSTLLTNGFLDALMDLDGVKVVGELDLSSGSTEQVSAFLRDHNDIDVIFCTNSAKLPDIEASMTELRYTAALFGVGADQKAVDALRAPGASVVAVAAADYYTMGYQAMGSLLGEPVGEDAPILLLTPQDTAALDELEARLGS